MKKYRIYQKAMIGRWAVVEAKEDLSDEEIEAKAIDNDIWYENDSDFEWETNLIEIME
jgi:hypothetical protein